MWRIDSGRTPCGQPGCDGVVSDFVSVTLLNYMLIGITPLPFIIFLGLQMFVFGIIHEGRVVLNPQRTELGLEDVRDLRGKLPVLAKLLSRCHACLQSQTQGCMQVVPQNASAVLLNRRLLQPSMISPAHGCKVVLELQACVGVPDMDAFLLFYCLGVTSEIGMAFISFKESWH